MTWKRRHVLGGIELVTKGLVMRETSLAGGVGWGLVIAGTVVTALAPGHVQYVADVESESEKRPFFESREAYTGFWALFAHAMAAFGGAGDPTTFVPA